MEEQEIENCQHNFKQGETVWRHSGLWKHLIMVLFCEKCGKIIEKTLDTK